GCALWVLFAPSFGSQVPHLRLVNCGLAPLLGTKIPPQNPADLLPTLCAYFAPNFKSDILTYAK
ncbi:MAG: hypothetical protein J6R10_03040, partial [Tidjanibacter sp.]|nr:hypothetical protein [Tidjanibacter sp.]